MNLRGYITVLAIGTAIALSSWAIILIAIDPLSAGLLALIVFYVTLASGLVGLLTITGTLFRTSRFPEAGPGVAIIRSFRQGVLFTLLIIASLLLMRGGMFSTALLVLMIGVLALIEFFFLMLQDRKVAPPDTTR